MGRVAAESGKPKSTEYLLQQLSVAIQHGNSSCSVTSTHTSTHTYLSLFGTALSSIALAAPTSAQRDLMTDILDHTIAGLDWLYVENSATTQ